MSEARKKLNDESKKVTPYKLVRPELTAEDVMKLRRQGIRVTKLSSGITPEQYGHVYSIGSDAQYRVTISDEELKRLEELKRQEEKTKEDIKRKKEELRLKREEKLVAFKHDIRVMIDDEEKGIKYYEGLIIKANILGLHENIRDLTMILSEERKHLSLLKEMMGTWITPMRKEKQATYLPSGRPIPRRFLET